MESSKPNQKLLVDYDSSSDEEQSTFSLRLPSPGRKVVKRVRAGKIQISCGIIPSSSSDDEDVVSVVRSGKRPRLLDILPEPKNSIRILAKEPDFAPPEVQKEEIVASPVSRVVLDDVKSRREMKMCEESSNIIEVDLRNNQDDVRRFMGAPEMQIKPPVKSKHKSHITYLAELAKATARMERRGESQAERQNSRLKYGF